MTRPAMRHPTMRHPTMKRRALLLAAAPALLPAFARAQPVATPPAPPTVPVPPASPPAPAAPPPPLPSAPTVPPPPRPVATPAAPPPIEPGKQYFVFFNQAITTATMRTLDRQLVTLTEGGVHHVTLVLNSPGGLVYEALTAYSLIRALPARIDTHAVGFVASAATTLFLAGEHRTADRNARFLFHPTQAPPGLSATAQETRDRLAMFGTVDSIVSDILRDRTNVPPAEIERFEHQEVFYTAQQALDAGIVDEIADLRIPGEGQARTVFLD